MSKLKTLTIPDHHKVQAKAVLDEAADEAPDTVIVLCLERPGPVQDQNLIST
jgi:hypothetical protein